MYGGKGSMCIFLSSLLQLTVMLALNINMQTSNINRLINKHIAIQNKLFLYLLIAKLRQEYKNKIYYMYIHVRYQIIYIYVQ